MQTYHSFQFVASIGETKRRNLCFIAKKNSLSKMLSEAEAVRLQNTFWVFHYIDMSYMDKKTNHYLAFQIKKERLMEILRSKDISKLVPLKNDKSYIYRQIATSKGEKYQLLLEDVKKFEEIEFCGTNVDGGWLIDYIADSMNFEGDGKEGDLLYYDDTKYFRRQNVIDAAMSIGTFTNN